MLKDLQRVLDQAHAGHTYVSDSERYGLAECWTAGLVGDCEDFALWCRAKLNELDIWPDLVYCLTEKGEGHLVLHIDGWILDNRYGWVQKQDDLPYSWVKLGRPDGKWFLIE